MEHAIHRPAVFAATAIRGFLKTVASGLLVLTLIAGFLELHWHREMGLVETPLAQHLVAPGVDCGIRAESGSSFCQQSALLFFFGQGQVSGQVFCTGLCFPILDAPGQFQHRPESPLRPPTSFSSIA